MVAREVVRMITRLRTVLRGGSLTGKTHICYLCVLNTPGSWAAMPMESVRRADLYIPSTDIGNAEPALRLRQERFRNSSRFYNQTACPHQIPSSSNTTAAIRNGT